MSDSNNNNLVKVYSPKGELFEVTKVNARDLTTHAGFTTTPPNGVVCEAPADNSKEEAEAAAAAAKAAEEAKAAEAAAAAAEEAKAAEAAAAAAAANAGSDEETKVRLTEEDFADLEDKAAVRAYIEATFPGTDIDGRSNREKLIAMAIELATAE